MSEFFIHKKTATERWYKEPWMLLVLGGPFIVVIAAVTTFYIAWQGTDEVVSRDYYRQGLNINKDISRDAKAVEYGLTANAKVESTSGKAQLQLEGRTGLPASLLMTISSYSRGSEYEALQKITLNQVKPGLYEGIIKIPAPSEAVDLKLWHVKILGPDWRLTADWRDPLHSTLQLKP